jgi:hypothetical protein
VERTLRGRDHQGISAAGVVLVVVAGVVLLGLLSDGPGLGALLVVGAVAYLVARQRREPRPVSPDGAYAPVDLAAGPGYGPVPPPIDDPRTSPGLRARRRAGVGRAGRARRSAP